MAQFGFDQLCHRPGHAHGLILQTFADALAAAVNGGADADLWQRAAQLVFRRVLFESSHLCFLL